MHDLGSHQCRSLSLHCRRKECQVTEDVCGKHFEGQENHEQTSPLHRSPGIDSSDTDVKSPNTEVELAHQPEDIKRSPHRTINTCRDDVIVQPPGVELEQVPGPSFMSVSLMDIMEALRLTQLKLDPASEDTAHLKQAFQTVLPQDDGRPPPSPPPPPSPAARDGSAPDDRSTRLEHWAGETTTTGSHAPTPSVNRACSPSGTITSAVLKRVKAPHASPSAQLRVLPSSSWKGNSEISQIRSQFRR